MDDYRGKLVKIQDTHVARCVGQDFIMGKVYFETPDGREFEYQGEYGLEKIVELLTYEDVKDSLPKVRG